MRAIAALVVGLWCSVAWAQNLTVNSFEHAKDKLWTVYADHRFEFYCGCAFDENGQINLSTCGFTPKNESARSTRIEWDHIVPAEAFGQSFVEWRDGHADCVDHKGKKYVGRKCAEKANPVFRRMEADMYNLVPTIGEVNQAHSNYSMAMITGATIGEFGKCAVVVADRKFQPPPEVRGDIARIYFYMDGAYPGHGIISNKNRPLYEAWAKEDPVDAWECDRARRIEKIEGSPNRILKPLCDSRVVPPKTEAAKPTAEPKKCCRVCHSTQPCGDSCISREKICSQPPGCACSE